MSTLSTINVKHPSSASNNLVLDSSGNATVAGTLTANSVIGGGFSNLKAFIYQTGTYTRSGTLVTCTVTAHGLSSNDSVVIDFITGGALDGTYTVTVTGANTFTLNTAASGTITTSNMAITGYNWVIPASVTKVKATVVGGGGGSGSVNTFCSGGGGGGGSAIKIVSGLTPGNTVTATVGAGGTAGSGGSGGTGGTSSFGAHCSATGGSGSPAAVGPGSMTGANGGVGSSGDLNINGGRGTTPLFYFDGTSDRHIQGGTGGSSILGGGGGVYGGGANGVASSGILNGTAGSAGVVVVEY